MPFICFIALAQIKKILNGLPWVWEQKESGHFIRYRHRVTKVQETFLWGFGNFCFRSSLYWIEFWRLWCSFDCSELIMMPKKPVWHNLSSVTWCVFPVGSSHQKTGTLWFERDGHGCINDLNSTHLVLRRPKCAKKISPQHFTPPPDWTVDRRQGESRV